MGDGGLRPRFVYLLARHRCDLSKGEAAAAECHPARAVARAATLANAKLPMPGAAREVGEQRCAFFSNR